MTNAPLEGNLRVVLARFVRALLLVVAILLSLQAVGIDLTVLSVFGGALGVGIGLGLQKLASNYIAGFTILMDRSVRIGDLVTVDNRYGTVAKVTARYVVVRSLDGVEAIVPNETLVTTTVLNHSYTNKNARVAVNVQVSYDTDLDAALELMEGAGALRVAGARHPGAEGFRRAVRRQRHRPRARRMDQRSRSRAPRPAQRAQSPDPGGVPGARDPDSVPPAGGARRAHARAPGRALRPAALSSRRPANISPIP